MHDTAESDPASDLDATAYHEAGHVVMSFDLRRAVVRVSIDPDACLGPDNLGHVHSGRPPGWFSPDLNSDGRSDRWIEREIRVLLAGPATERHRTGRDNFGGAAWDLDAAADLATRMHGNAEVAGKYLAYLEAAVRATIATPIRWARVEALAAALLERRTLSGAEARRIYRGAVAAKMARRSSPPGC